MSSDGRPTVSSTITMVTNPADGIPAAPIEAAVAVTLFQFKNKIPFEYSVFILHSESLSLLPDSNQFSK